MVEKLKRRTYRATCQTFAVHSLAMTCIFGSAYAQTNAASLEAEAPQVKPIVAPVLYAYVSTTNAVTQEQSCWQVLTPERDVLIREQNARPWLSKNLVPLVGAAMGGLTAGLVLKRHTSAAVTRRWAIPIVVGGAAGGFFLGPGAVVGAVVGGAIGEKLGKRKLPITLGGTLGGALAGKAIWDKIFPPAVPPLPGNEPDDDIPVEVFLREQTCAVKPVSSYDQSSFRVGYQVNGEEFVADLPYDPGEALLIDGNGAVVGPARVRIE
jgi:hypothetical protein